MDFIDDLERTEDYIPKKKRETIEIPEFLSNKEEIPLNEEDVAVLNNTPGNVEIEEMNHLNGLEKYAQNLTEEEWRRYLYYAPSTMMFAELQRRMSGFEEYRLAQKNADEIMNNLKL